MFGFFIRGIYVLINFEMRISYNWLKWYIPDAPDAQKLADSFTYHLAEVESVEAHNDDFILDIKILPNRAHDLLSHQGMARELASLLNIKYADPTELYKIPSSKPSTLSLKIESEKCRRYMGRIVRGVKVEPSPDWVGKHLESIGQRSVNNMVDAANIVMFDCGQPTHVFDLNKIKGGIVVRQAKEGETMITLDNKECKFKDSDLVIADDDGVLAVAGVKGGKSAEVDIETTDIILEVANFDPVSVRKTASRLNIFTDAKKRFENDLSPELGGYAMREFSATILEMCPGAVFEDVVDEYPIKQKEQKLSFSVDKIAKILGEKISEPQIKDILERYSFTYKEKNGQFEIAVPYMRLDLTLEEDMAEEIGRILGYDKVKPKIPKINFQPKVNETFAKISWARKKLLEEGHCEVMTYAFKETGEVEVLASASDKKFLRTNLIDGLMESIKLNSVNAPLLDVSEIKVFEVGTVFTKEGEEIHVAYGDKKKVTEVKLDEYASSTNGFLGSSEKIPRPLENHSSTSQKHSGEELFRLWSTFPFVARDVAVWVPEEVESDQVCKVIKENSGDLVVKGPELFDEFKKGDKISYAFRIVFQSYEKTLTDAEVNEWMDKTKSQIEKKGWQVR